jgi:hypothetical protein
MKVYPVNVLDDSTMKSQQKHPASVIEALYNKYIELTVDFLDWEVEITGGWSDKRDADSIIIGNTNAVDGRISLYNDGVEIYRKEFLCNEFLNIVERNINGRPEPVTFNSFRLMLYTRNINTLVYLGYLYIGKVWQLPRFVVGPSYNVNMRNETDRTFSGAVTGVPTAMLRSFNCSFVRIENKDMKKIDNYVNAVQSVIPHVIDTYYEAHDEFEPMYCTIDSSGDRTKRSENNFYWNFDMSWQEAK